MGRQSDQRNHRAAGGPPAERPLSVDEGEAEAVAQRTGGQEAGNASDGVRQAIGRQQDAEAEQQHPGEVGQSEDALGADGPGEQQAQREERRRAKHHGHE